MKEYADKKIFSQMEMDIMLTVAKHDAEVDAIRGMFKILCKEVESAEDLRILDKECARQIEASNRSFVDVIKYYDEKYRNEKEATE